MKIYLYDHVGLLLGTANLKVKKPPSHVRWDDKVFERGTIWGNRGTSYVQVDCHELNVAEVAK